jgi:serine/threonine protein kinase
MELAAGGEVLGYVMKKERLSEPSARKILLQVVNSMIYCHTRGVVHRDLKLENVLFRDPISDDDQDLYVKVIDFGIAGVCANQVSRTNKTLVVYVTWHQNR